MLPVNALPYIHYSIIFLVIISAGIFFGLLFLKNSHKVINLFTIAIINFISLPVAGWNVMLIKSTSDELNIFTGYHYLLFGILVILSIVNFLIAAYLRFRKPAAN